MLIDRIMTSLEKKFPTQEIEFKLEKSRVSSDKPVLLAGVTRYQLMLNQQPTALFLDQDEVEALEKKHGAKRAEKLAVQSATARIRDLIKEQTNSI